MRLVRCLNCGKKLPQLIDDSGEFVETYSTHTCEQVRKKPQPRPPAPRPVVVPVS